MKGVVLKKIMSLTLVAAVSGSLALVSGCSDSQSAENVHVVRVHEQVNDILTRAQRSYVPGDQPQDLSLAAWRQQQQAEARKQLSEIASQGSPSQQIMTKRLISDTYDSAARSTLLEAVTSWARISPRGTLLLSHLQTVDRSDEQMRSYSFDESKLVASLREQIQRLRNQSQATQKDLDQVNASVKELAGKIDSLSGQLGQLASQAATLREQAFSQTGKERYESYDKASQIAIRSNRISAELQALTAKRDIDQADAAVLSQQYKLADEAAGKIEEQLKNLQSTVEARNSIKAKAQEKKAEGIKTLDTELEQVANQYKALMEEGFGKALADVDAAIKQLDEAIALAKDDQTRRVVQFDLLARKTSRLNVLKMQAAAAGDWARKLKVIASIAADSKRPGGELISGKSTFYETTAQAAVNDHGKIVADALQTANEANELVSQLTQSGADSDPIATNATQLAGIVAQYTRQINANKP